VVVSNVPGPRVPLYLAGARMATNYPVSIVTHSLGLNVTVQSYNGSLDFGIIACRRAMPDIALFATCMAAAHADLLAAAQPAPEAPIVVKKRRAAPRKTAAPAKTVPKPAPKRKPRPAAPG
jgi:diacylglycerol O-acyltransferase